MPKRIRTIRDNIRHRRIVSSNPLARIPEGAPIGEDVYHSTPAVAEQAAGSDGSELAGAA